MVSALLLLLSLLIDIFSKSTDSTEAEALVDSQKLRRKRFLFSSITVVLSVIVASLIGVLFAVPASFICLFLLFKGKESLYKSIGISILAMGIIYVVFGILFGVPITEGLLW